MRLARKPIVLAFIVILAGAAAAGQALADPATPPRGDLGTRTAGSDWPSFLGPTGDNKSPETGLRIDWPKEGPRVVWQQRLGTGYGMPVISRGRLYQFTRVRDQARLMCLRSETGELLWQFEYPTDYEDLYGYDNGPLVADRRRRSSLHSRRRRKAALPGGRRRPGDLEGRYGDQIRRDPELLRCRQHAGH